MNRQIGRIALAATLLAPRFVLAQGTTYLSNLGQPSAGSNPVGSDSWYAANFFTGTNAGGYSFDSFQLGMADVSGTPSDFTAMLYSTRGGAAPSPGSSLGTLIGSLNPTTAGIYTYTPATTLALSPGTEYFIVLTAGTPVAAGAYNWDYVGAYAYSQEGGWRTFADILNSGNGSSWTLAPTSDALFAITATPVPEPGILGLSALGALVFFWQRRKAKAAVR